MARFMLPRTKTVAERFRVSVDFKNDLKVGDTVTAHVVTARRMDTNADATGTFLGTIVRTLTLVEVVVQNGVVDVDYEVKFAVDTAQGDHFEGFVVVPVRA